MCVSEDLIELIPEGEENAVSGRLLWKQLGQWSSVSVKHNLRLMARQGLIDRKQILHGGHVTNVYFRSRV